MIVKIKVTIRPTMLNLDTVKNMYSKNIFPAANATIDFSNNFKAYLDIKKL